MNSNPLEKDIEASVVKFAKAKGCLAYKFTSPSMRSVPDRLFFPPGAPAFAIEFKRAGCKPTPAQLVEIQKIRKQGTLVFVVDNVEAGRNAVNVGMSGRVDLDDSVFDQAHLNNLMVRSGMIRAVDLEGY